MLTTLCVLISILYGSSVQQASASLPLPVCSLESKCEEYQKPDNNKRFFKVNGTKLSIDGNARQLILQCITESPPPLDVGALPRFSAERAVEELFVDGCVLGRAGVRDVLRALHARVDDLLALEHVQEPLRAEHVRGLPVRRLSLETFESFRTRVDDDFFAGSNLTGLWTSGVEYDVPPAGLEKWTTKNANYSRLPRGVLSSLKLMYLTEQRLSDVSALEEALELRNLSVEGRVRGALPRLPALRTLWTSGWRGLERAPLACPQLESLSVLLAGPLRPLPGWLADCTLLARLELRWSPLLALPRDLLRGARKLRELTIYSADLTSDMLPDDLLETNTELTSINFSHNKLTTIPSEVFFKRALQLSELDLSWNRLVSPGAWSPALPALRSLWLAHNPLGDACPERGTADVAVVAPSWLRELRALRHLSLRNTSAARLCPDWLESPRLQELDLSHNLITELKYRDLHPRRSQPSKIILENNKISTIEYQQEDFNLIQNQTDRSETEIILDRRALLHCDCHMYWFARALREYPNHVHVKPLFCAGGIGAIETSVPTTGAPANSARRTGALDLRRVPLDALTCSVECPAECRCRVVPARAALEAECDDLPMNHTLHPNYDSITNLSLAGRGLQSVSAARLPAALASLDLRNNSLTAADDARALLRRPGLRLRLAGNALDCRCGHRDFLDALLEHKSRVSDLARLACADGRAWSAACAGGALGGALAALGALALAAALAAAAVLHPTPRAKLKVILMVLGVRVPGGGGGGSAWRYDAFVSFAEADAAFVAGVLAPALEGGRRPRRLCLHHRDWRVGELITTQIEESVAGARRTVLVVSDAFARSAWARAELELALARAAQDGRPAPLAVLLAAPGEAALAAAPALAAYLRAATYLRADDPAFRRKLRAAVPAEPAPLPEVPPAA